MKIKRSAFTIIEVLCAVGIAGLLAGIAIPAFQAVRSQARNTECSNNLRQVTIALHSYCAVRGHFPAGVHAKTAKYRSMSFLAQLLPFVEHEGLWNTAVSEYSSGLSPFTPHTGLQTVIPTFQCPSSYGVGEPQITHGDRYVAMTCYLGVNGTSFLAEDGVLFRNSRTRFKDIADGMSHTLLMGERPPSPDYWYGWWYAGTGQQASGSPDMLLGVREMNVSADFMEQSSPGPYEFVAGDQSDPSHVFHYWSLHSGGAHFSFADGSIRFLPYSANDLLPSLATRSGHEIVRDLN
jgi:prepilin-type N-terminal cleavage/methylation domain-containing protein/prepilin-type processing-associated H-X9-DG protein